METNVLKLAIYNSLKVFPSKLWFSKKHKINPGFVMSMNECGDVFLTTMNSHQGQVSNELLESHFIGLEGFSNRGL